MIGKRAVVGIFASAALLSFTQCTVPHQWSECYPIHVPRLKQPPCIDGDLADWKDVAFNDGVWDIRRLQHMPWFNPSVNRLTDHGSEPPPEDDLSARYYLAWDDDFLYLGAEVHDNVNDIADPNHEPKRWYFKDAVCWFFEAPRTGKSKSFGEGNHAFCFAIDPSKPPWGAWWRHGDRERQYIESPLPPEAVIYAIRLNPWGGSRGDFILEARVRMASTFGVASAKWKVPKIGDKYGLEIVHTDPDGGGYGGHFLIYGMGDDAATWGTMTFVGPIGSVVRKPE